MGQVNYLASVSNLVGRENYGEWSFAIENVFILDGLSKCLMGTETEAGLIAKAKAMVLSIDPSQYVHVKDVTNAKDLWKKLRDLYDDSGFARKISLFRALISLRLENCDSMEQYVNQLIETAQKLNRSGFKVDDEWVGLVLLAGLPEKFAPMIMAIEYSGIIDYLPEDRLLP